MPAGLEDTQEFIKAAAVVDEVAEAEADGDEVEAIGLDGQVEPVGLKQRGIGLLVCADEHREAEVSAEIAGGSYRFEGDEQVSCAAAEVEDTGFWLKPGPQYTGGSPAPEPVDLQTEDAVEQVIAGGDATEHVTDPGRRLGLGKARLWLGTADGHLACGQCSGGGFSDEASVDAGDDGDFADASGEHEVDFAVERLFISAKAVEQGIGSDAV